MKTVAHGDHVILMWRGSCGRCEHCASGRPAARQRAAWRAAWVSTQSPMGTMKPVSSATGMKRAGDTSPHSGSRQRISASAPTTWPVFRSSCGW